MEYAHSHPSTAISSSSGRRPPSRCRAVLALVLLSLCFGSASAFGQTPLGPNFRTSTWSQSSSEQYPAISFSPKGELVVVWLNGFPPDVRVEGRRFASDGEALGPMFEVRDSSQFQEFATPLVSHAIAGGFVVAWCEGPFMAQNLLAQRYDSAANKVGNAYIVVPGQCDAHFSHSPQGGYHATWVKDGVLSVQHFIGTQAQGAAVTVAGLPATGPRISHASDGSFVIVWKAGTDALMGRRFDANQNALGAAFEVDGAAPPPVPPFGPATPQRPRISHAPDGRFAVAIERSIGGGFQFDAYFRVFEADGTPLTAELQVTPTFSGLGNVDPEIAFDSNDGFSIVWSRAVQAYARRFDPSGAALSPEYAISSEPTVTSDFSPAIAARKGLFAVTWNDDITGFVLARRFSTPSKVPSTSLPGALVLLVFLAAAGLVAGVRSSARSTPPR